MGTGTAAGFGLLGAVLILVLVVAAILWIFVPFILMGTNGRLDKLLQQNQQIIDLLKARQP